MAAAAVVFQISVSTPSAEEKQRPKGEHWKNGKGTLFTNPWPSFAGVPGPSMMAKGMYKMITTPTDPNLKDTRKVIPQMKADFSIPHPSSKLKATWLGHACFLVELPAEKEGTKGVTVLFDPIFSQRCSPLTWMGPSRYTPAPCTIDDLPEVDVIVISHNHYDHEDLPSLQHLYQKHASRPPAMFVPLNTAHTMAGIVPASSITECDWWDEREVTVEGKGKALVICTPCQHFTGRHAFGDRNASLWASWALRSLPSSSSEQVGASVWFGGDTGYCSVDDDSCHHVVPGLPICPAFKEIGDKLGPFTLGLIPIGAYSPRSFMSRIHNAPIDSVRMFKDTKCKQALGIHWGTWWLTNEPIDEPPKRLATAREVVGLKEEEFTTCAIGETKVYDV